MTIMRALGKNGLRRHGRLRTRMGLCFAILTVLVSAFFTLALFFTVRSQVRKEVRDKLLGSLRIAVLSIDGDAHATIRDGSAEGNKTHLQLERNLKSLRLKAGVDVKGTFRQNDLGQTIHITDSYLTSDPDYNPVLSTHPGDIYAEAGSPLGVILASLEGPLVLEEYYSDKWGDWMTGYAPFFTTDGLREGILGVDVSVTQVLARERQALWIALVIFAFLAPLSAVLGWFVGGWFLRPIRALKKSAERIASGDLAHRATIQTEDEIGELASAFNHMNDKLRILRQEIEKNRVNLEQEVNSRTEELTEANKQLEEAIEKTNRLAEISEAANMAKTEFISNLSHEIRTPMNSILGFSEMLEEEIEDPRQRHYISSVISSGRILLDLINDLLDLSKIESGKMHLEREPADPVAVLQEVGRIFESKAQEKGLELVVQVDPSLPGQLLLDEVRLRQILFNLVGNAIKFTSEGSVRLLLEKIENAESSALDIIFKVEDTGIGIPQEDQDRIFDSFVQQSGHRTRQFEGTGLGLAITKRLVELMGGSISVESELGKGSVFTVNIRELEVAALSENEAKKEEASAEEELHFDPSTVLIVEDSIKNRELIREFLRESGLLTLEAENGKDACELAAKEMPDLILMDISMPVMDGREASRFIRSDAKTGQIPIIVLTASALEERELWAGQLSLEGFLTKPIGKHRLLAELKHFLPHSVLLKTKPRTKQAVSVFGTSPRQEMDSLPLMARDNLPNLLKLLEGELKEEWVAVQNRSRIGPIKNFLAKIRTLGEKSDVKLLLDFSSKLENAAVSFDVDQMGKILSQYPELINSLKRFL